MHDSEMMHCHLGSVLICLNNSRYKANACREDAIHTHNSRPFLHPLKINWSQRNTLKTIRCLNWYRVHFIFFFLKNQTVGLSVAPSCFPLKLQTLQRAIYFWTQHGPCWPSFDTRQRFHSAAIGKFCAFSIVSLIVQDGQSIEKGEEGLAEEHRHCRCAWVCFCILGRGWI